jgi:hypothetical protein
MSQVRLIQLQVFAAIEEANAGVAPERRVTPKSALTVVKRSLNSTRDLPFEVREFHAMRELSAFISLVQRNNFSDTFTNHTDLLTSAHPSSTRTHGLSASALSKARLRWILSDSRISEQARPLLASMFTSPKTSAEYKYAEVRLNTLPRGSYPLEALTAAFGDGNSFIARRARAMLQRRDRKGRFAFQGGGASALVERANGVVQRLTGRVVSQGENGDVVRIQLPNGRLVDVPTDGAEFIKAVIGKNKDGFSGVKAKYKAGDIILNEEDLEFFEAPHGFRKDEGYKGPGVKYTDDEYDVVKEANNFAISRREDGKSLGSADNWADAQKAIFDDEPVADKEAGREPIARLNQEQIDRMYDDPNFDPKDILTPDWVIFDDRSGQDKTSEIGEFKYNYPEGAYQLPLDVKYAEGFADPANDSDDFTDDPKELAQKFSSEALVNALRNGLLPGDGSKANGEGVLQFERKEPVPVEALYLALEEKGDNAKLEVAKIYDALNGDKKNQEALARLEGAPAPKARITPKAATPEAETPALSGLEEEPSEPPMAAMRKGQVSPGGDWKWYPPVRMGGNQQLQGHWGLTEKGVAKLPPKEVKTPPAAALEPVLPDEIGGGWKPTNDLDSPKKNPAYEKTIDGVKYKFIQSSDGSWSATEIRNGERYGVGIENNSVDVADPAAFDDKIAQIIDAKQKQNRADLKKLLTEQGFNEEVIGLIDEANAADILAAVTADPAYPDLQAKHERFMQGERNAPFRAESKAFLAINNNLDKIRDNYEQPDVADAVTDVRGGIPTSSEIQRMLDGEGIGSQDEISGDAPSEVLPRAKAVLEEKQEQDPEKRNDILEELNVFAERANKALDLVEQLEPADEGMDTNRISSAGESVNLAEDMLPEAMVNVDDPSILDNNIQQAVWHLTEAINTLADVKSPEAPGVRSEIIELRDELEAYRGTLEAELKKDKISIDKLVKHMLVDQHPGIEVEDIIARVIPIEEEAPEAAAPPGGGGPPNNPPAPGGPPGPGSGSGPGSGPTPTPTPVPEPTPPAGPSRRVRNNNVAANRRWQARFGIKPPVFYKKNRGMFYDINGVPVNVGDKVTHNNPDKDEKYGEGVVISRIPNLGRWRIGRAGEQVKVDYASYVWVQFANGKKAKLATRMLINKNPDSVENPANSVKPMRDAEMPPPDVYIENWKKFGKALEEFGVVPGKDARGNEGFQADAGNAQQMVISKDADGNYAVYLKEENIWRNRQVEPLFVTKNLPEAANYFIAEVHNRRYQTDFPPNPVWMGDKAPTAAPNPETNVVDVPEAGTVSNVGLPNVVNIDTNGKFEDLQKQIQDAIDNGQQIAFNYKGEDRLVTPKRIWTNPKNGNINLDAVGEDGFKVYTIVNMENANNPVEATPIPEADPIPEDVAPNANVPGSPEALIPINENNERNWSPSDFEDGSGWQEGPNGLATHDNGDIVDYGPNAGWFAVVAGNGFGPSRVGFYRKPKSLGYFRSRKEAIDAVEKYRAGLVNPPAAPEKDKPFLEDVSLEAQREDAKKDFEDLGNKIVEKAVDGVGASDPEVAELYRLRDEALNRMVDLGKQIKQRDAAPEVDEDLPKSLEDQLADAKKEYEDLDNEMREKYKAGVPGNDKDLKDLYERRNEAFNKILDLNEEIKNQDLVAQGANEYLKDVVTQFNDTPENAENGLEVIDYIDRSGFITIRDPENDRQFQLRWDEDAQAWRIAPGGWEGNKERQWFADINEAVAVATSELLDAKENLSKEREGERGHDVKDFERYVDGLEGQQNIKDLLQDQYDIARFDEDGILYIGDKNNNNQANIVWDEDAQGYRVEFRPLSLAAPADGYVVYADIKEAGDYAVEILDNARFKVGTDLKPEKETDSPQSLEDELAEVNEEIKNLNDDIQKMYEDGIGPNDIGMKDLVLTRNEQIQKAKDLEQKIKERDAANVAVAPTGAPTDRVVPIPRINIPEPDPIDSKDAQLIKDIAAAQKDLKNLKRQIGPQNAASNYREKVFISRIQGLKRELDKGNTRRAKSYYDNAVNLLNAGIGNFDANTYEDYKARLEKMAVFFGEDVAKPANPETPFNGAPIEEVNPEKIAQERIAAGENISPVLYNFWKDELLNNEKLDELAQQGLDIREYKDELQKFFAGEPKPMAELSEDARFALQALLQRKIVNPRKTTDEKQNIKNIVELVNALHNERLAYEPGDGANLDARGALLLQFSPGQMEKAAKNGRLVQNGQDLGFKIELTGAGGGRTGENKTYRVVDERTGKVYFYKKDTTGLNIDSELAALEVARALGLHGVYPAERHPTIDNVVVMGVAGQNLKLKESPVVYGQAAPGDSDIVEKSPVNQVFQFMILDAVIHNNDRHGQNWLVGRPQDRGQKYKEIRYIPLAIDNGLGQIIDTNEDRYGQDELNPVDYIVKRNGANRNQGVSNELLEQLGSAAFYEMMQLSTQQALQALRRSFPPGSNPSMDLLIDRLEELRNADLKIWRR